MVLPATRALDRDNQALQESLRRQWAAAWPLLDLRRLDSTFDRWLVGASRVEGNARTQAANTGLDYLAALGFSGDFLPDPLNAAAWAVSMHVLTVATVKRAMADGLTLGVAGALAQRRSLGSATRRMLDAERSVVAQGSVLGWKRVSAGVPDCDFCGMLIGRGAVYTEASAKFESHDHCDCLVEPVLG